MRVPTIGLLLVAFALVLTACAVELSPVPSASPASQLETGSPSGSSTPSGSAGPSESDPAAAPGSRSGEPGETAAPWSSLAPAGPTQIAQVVRVVDGDTITVSIGEAVYTVRYIGMDTPETVKPSSPVEWMGPEASAANETLVDGQEVILEKDVSETDRYGRLLRDVWLRSADGWLLVGLELVRLGYAQVSTYPPDVKYVDELLAAQREARDAGRELWGATPPPGSSPTVAASASGSVAPGCDPAYPTVCIPPPPPDLDCGQVSYRDFTVLPPDPHRFDGDHDGIGCES